MELIYVVTSKIITFLFLVAARNSLSIVMPITFPFQLLLMTNNARFFHYCITNHCVNQYFLLYPSSNPRTTTSEMRSVDNWIKAGQFCRHYVEQEIWRNKENGSKYAIGVRQTDSPYPLTMILRKLVGRLGKNVACRVSDSMWTLARHFYLVS